MNNTNKQRDCQLNINDNKIIFWNAQSLSEKLNELRNEISKVNPEIIAIVETWYKDNNAPTIKNYNEIHKNRENQRGGGIQIFVKDTIGFQEISLTNYNNGTIEYIYIEISSKEKIKLLYVSIFDGQLH